ncbi:hypothetical protein ACFYPC_14665 [Streptomyces sp. NPDC005808]|uniref:hypothetical protein n=1 Tax=Streptomyces sp. NPDC005808 TaxID=3364734 RepID=UPI0036D1A117
MTNTTNDRNSTSRGLMFRAPPLPEGPGEASSWGERSSLLRAQADAIGALVREDLSRGRAAVFLACAVVLTAACALVPVVLVDAATSEGNDATDVAVAAVLACMMLAFFAVPAILVLRALRMRGSRRRQLMRQWAAADRGYDSEFPSHYGARGYPHPRFFNAALVLTVVLVVAVAVLADLSDPSVLAMLPGLVVAGLLSWSTIMKYADRYGWASREQMIRSRERRRCRHRGEATKSPVAQATSVHPAVLYAVFIAPLAVVALVFVVGRPSNALGLAVAGLLALALLAVGLPKVLLRRRREWAALGEAVQPLTAEFGSSVMVHPIRYGINEPSGQAPAAGASAWDYGPTRMGVLAVDGDTLHLRGVDGAAVALQFTDLVGVALIPNTVAWLDPTVDLLLRSGDAIEVRSADAQAITDELSAAGARTVSV